MTTIEDIHSIVLEIQSSLQKVLSEKQSLNQSSILGIDDSLIERFQSEILRLGIEEELIPGTFDEELVLNKASYYFEHVDKINNRRAYLTKILSQIPRHKISHSMVSEPEPVKPELSDQEIEDYLYKYESLSDDMIKEIIHNNEKIGFLVWGFTRQNYKAFHKVVFAKKALEMGLIS